MIQFIKNIKYSCFMLMAAGTVLTACNKDLEQFPETATPPPSGASIGESLETTADLSLYNRLVARAGMTAMLKDKSKTYSVFAPNNNAMKQFINAASGGAVPINAPDAVFEGFIQANLPVASAAGIVGYNTVPQKLVMAGLSSNFPNFQYPTILNPAPQISALLRLTTFPTSRNGNYVNNIPLLAVDQNVANGVIHQTAALVAPPTQFLWERIAADDDLDYLQAAILRADSGTGNPGTLQSALLNIGANLTVFAPTDAVFQATLTGALYQALLGLGYPQAQAQALATALAEDPDVFENPSLYFILTAQTVKGIVVYHLLGQRAFTNNFPTTEANFPTLLNGAIPSHPGLGLEVGFTGPMASSATVKSASNPVAASILINPTPAPNGSSDQHYLNGVLHKINQVLFPQ